MVQHNASKYIPIIVERLKSIDPVKVILFGSQAYSDSSPDSDIDLLVVINSDHFPESYKEKSELYLDVSRQIRDIRKQVPIDLIVHTKPMHKRFIELDSMFAREVAQNGLVLYEADHQSLAQ